MIYLLVFPPGPESVSELGRGRRARRALRRQRRLAGVAPESALGLRGTECECPSYHPVSIVSFESALLRETGWEAVKPEVDAVVVYSVWDVGTLSYVRPPSPYLSCDPGLHKWLGHVTGRTVRNHSQSAKEDVDPVWEDDQLPPLCAGECL
jgi:hypothetical protein